ncbi:hypothetical protein [Segatella salivae]|uniref:hypothetical protein n=1 Tax=Segatella salivae TaxID=228604 RepID=UPI0028D55A24|nr:hypothetical protein [Segatella salivae]
MPFRCTCCTHDIKRRDGRLYGTEVLGEVRRNRSSYFTAAMNNNGMRVRFIPTIRFCGVAREIQVAVVMLYVD